MEPLNLRDPWRHLVFLQSTPHILANQEGKGLPAAGDVIEQGAEDVHARVEVKCFACMLVCLAIQWNGIRQCKKGSASSPCAPLCAQGLEAAQQANVLITIVYPRVHQMPSRVDSLPSSLSFCAQLIRAMKNALSKQTADAVKRAAAASSGIVKHGPAKDGSKQHNLKGGMSAAGQGRQSEPGAAKMERCE